MFVSGVIKKSKQIAKRMNIQTLQRRIQNNEQRRKLSPKNTGDNIWQVDG